MRCGYCSGPLIKRKEDNNIICPIHGLRWNDEHTPFNTNGLPIKRWVQKCIEQGLEVVTKRC